MLHRIVLSASLVALLAGCASVPEGPDVMALPGGGKSFDVFRTDDLVCRDFAKQQIGGEGGVGRSNRAAIETAAITTAIGAVAGAAIGDDSRSAGVGAGTGLVLGGIMGAESARGSGRTSQDRYDAAYIQCMYAKGHRVPVNGGYTVAPDAVQTTPTASTMPPPPPPGSPPPPPVSQSQ